MSPETQPFLHSKGAAEFVVDVSVARTWIVRNLGTNNTFDVMAVLNRSYAIAPRGFILELADDLLLLERQGQFNALQTDAELLVFMNFPIVIDDLTLQSAWGSVLSLARIHSLSCHRAAYLELAIRHSLPLATIDTSLTRAAAAAGVSLFVP
jgi:predicted nucleic acid-binding protein